MAEMSPLRRRLIEDMTVRNLSPATQRSYVHARACADGSQAREGRWDLPDMKKPPGGNSGKRAAAEVMITEGLIRACTFGNNEPVRLDLERQATPR